MLLLSRATKDRAFHHSGQSKVKIGSIDYPIGVMRFFGKRFRKSSAAGLLCVQMSFFSASFAQTKTPSNISVVTSARPSISKQQDFDEIRKKGFAYAKTKDWELANSAFETALQIKPKDPLSLYGKALALFNLQHTSDAETKLDAAILILSRTKDNDPLLADSLVLSGVIAAVQNKRSLAVEKLEKAIELVPGHFDANLSVGQAYFENGQIDKSIAAFRHAVSIQPGNLKARFFLATALEREGNSREALKEYSSMLRISPTSVEGNLGLGVLLLKTDGDNSVDGLKALQRAVTLDNQLYEGQITLGRTLVRLNRATEAIEHLKKAAEMAPNNPEPHFQLAIAYRKLGRRADADTETEIVKKIHESRREVSKI